ncbi:simple sugar transport system permease protein [Paenibacillus cellulosilyticus]|uniref:Simple sugar transport system permease protein n=1 Tax=Paenibacillus cellulosilyticus TaxID=375489 RepID=A0A2V2YS49_9BACL|nr:galactofuranose ABC transporter, permease protein YjfF [Paenibacillus cellulosilyticus]PWW00898.1 simple sugar transport system permease protein [Paenibacillus cellulosilyticus]QKS47554.1 sugar ABC transporter permease YjfF [Paenibacillus cellulosilyticus]
MLKRQHLPVAATIALFILMFMTGSFRYTGFFSAQVLFNLLIDNAFLLIVAIGMTFVIVSGGIDLSVGSMVALTTMLSAGLLQQGGWPAWAVIPFVLAVGALFGAAMGALIHYFKIQPFIVTLAGMFLARGLCYLISINTITIDNGFYTDMAQTKIRFGDYFVSPSVIIALVVLVLAIYIAHYTRFGRTTYAIGGSEQSALLMGLPVARTKIMVYMFSGFCSALGGVVFTFYMLSGYGLHAVGLELDAIAATVIGGTLLTGGVGYVFGTFAGVMIYGVIQTLIVFQGTLSSWWTRIIIGILLFAFIVLQRLFTMRSDRKTGSVEKMA